MKPCDFELIPILLTNIIDNDTSQKFSVYHFLPRKDPQAMQVSNRTIYVYIVRVLSSFTHGINFYLLHNK